MSWTPNPFNPLDGHPFKYEDDEISWISGTEPFETGIDTRDVGRCVVCGLGVGHQRRRIIPKGQHILWNQMKEKGFVPQQAKSVAHEPRNGISMCPNHDIMFDQFYFYIRWVPEKSRFVFINHSRNPDVEEYHGRAINLHVGDHRLPFHGAFLVHEGRVRAHWPLNRDRAIPSRIPWAPWIITSGRGGDGDGDGIVNSGESGPSVDIGGHHLRATPESVAPDSSTSGKVFIPTNPFTNPAILEALKASFAEQPNWKAAVREGTSWEGNADENAEKWRRLNRI